MAPAGGLPPAKGAFNVNPQWCKADEFDYRENVMSMLMVMILIMDDNDLNDDNDDNDLDGDNDDNDLDDDKDDDDDNDHYDHDNNDG